MHQKDVDTLNFFLILGVMWLIIVMIMGCASTPTTPTAAHPNEVLVTEFTQCWADYHQLGPLAVYFHDNHINPDKPHSAGWAWPGATEVHYVRPRVHEFSRWELLWLAGHEVCHVVGWWDENKTEWCNKVAYQNGRCR